jgi:hypothetical protein
VLVTTPMTTLKRSAECRPGLQMTNETDTWCANGNGWPKRSSARYSVEDGVKKHRGWYAASSCVSRHVSPARSSAVTAIVDVPSRASYEPCGRGVPAHAAHAVGIRACVPWCVAVSTGPRACRTVPCSKCDRRAALLGGRRLSELLGRQVRARNATRSHGPSHRRLA